MARGKLDFSLASPGVDQALTPEDVAAINEKARRKKDEEAARLRAVAGMPVSQALTVPEDSTPATLDHVVVKHSHSSDVYLIETVCGELLKSIPARRYREQSFPLNEFLGRQLVGIVCQECGRLLIPNEDLVCGGCDAAKFQQMLDTRNALIEGRKRLDR